VKQLSWNRIFGRLTLHSRVQASNNLWTQVARDLQSRIADGEYPVGSVLPPEPLLCVQYGVSRYTLRAALQVLQEHGLVSRRKNVGTRVEASGAMRFVASASSIEELAQYGSEHQRNIKFIREVVANRGLPALLQCAAGARWIHIGFTRMMSDAGIDKPLSWTDVYVDIRFRDVVDDVEKHPSILTGILIERRFGVQFQRIEQIISAVATPRGLATRLDTKPGSPALQILRRYTDADDAVLEASVTIFPSDRYVHKTYLLRKGMSSGAP
jgi:GntR family transcriptional regulator